MGDRFSFDIKCANCGKINYAYYAESSGFMSFTCEKCKKINWISMGFTARIVSKKKEKELYKKMVLEKKLQICTQCQTRFDNPLADMCGKCFEEA